MHIAAKKKVTKKPAKKKATKKKATKKKAAKKKPVKKKAVKKKATKKKAVKKKATKKKAVKKKATKKKATKKPASRRAPKWFRELDPALVGRFVQDAKFRRAVYKDPAKALCDAGASKAAIDHVAKLDRKEVEQLLGDLSPTMIC